METKRWTGTAQHGCDTVAGLNEIVRSGKNQDLVDDSLAVYEASLDAAAPKVIARLNGRSTFA